MRRHYAALASDQIFQFLEMRYQPLSHDRLMHHSAYLEDDEGFGVQRSYQHKALS